MFWLLSIVGTTFIDYVKADDVAKINAENYFLDKTILSDIRLKQS